MQAQLQKQRGNGYLFEALPPHTHGQWRIQWGTIRPLLKLVMEFALPPCEEERIMILV